MTGPMTDRSLLTVLLLSSRRLHLLAGTIEAMRSHFERVEPAIRPAWVCFDNGSSPEDRRRLEDMGFDALILSRENRGLGPAMNSLVAAVRTPYFLNLQDDWLLENPRGVPFVKEAIGILEADPRLGQVKLDAHHFIDFKDRQVYSGPFQAPGGGVPFFVQNPHMLWGGFSFPPGITRTEAVHRTGPFREDQPFRRGWAESEYSARFSRTYHAVKSPAMLLFRHMGDNEHCPGWEDPPKTAGTEAKAAASGKDDSSEGAVSPFASPRTPAYSILMVVHNASEMVKVSTLRTLRHSAAHDARLMVIDNASTDGVSDWLAMLAGRGDIDLLRIGKNIGHGPALELARARTRAPCVVALDSDAFPLVDDWLPRLRARLDGQVKAVGILHHRDYLHPSCLLIERKTLDEWELSFLNEKDKPSGLDVAERISHEIKRRGFEISGLARTVAQRRGSASEPVYLGSEYEGLVHHQWYTTRSVRAQGGPVDDVSPEDIERSLREVMDRYHAEPREVTVVVGIRARRGEPQRLRNAKTCLWALNFQGLERWRYRIVVVEQDAEPRLKAALAPLADQYVFAYNPGAYNRGWAFNVGAMLPGNGTGALCLIDADLLVPADFLSRGLAALQTGQRAMLPYTEVLYLDPAATEQATRDRLARPFDQSAGDGYSGTVNMGSQGGCIWVDAALYREIGGHDERFRGWGREDREFCRRLEAVAPITRLEGRLLHLDHPKPHIDDRLMEANRKLAEELATTPPAASLRPIGSLDLYAAERNGGVNTSLEVHAGGRGGDSR